MRKLQILGSGCAHCRELTARATAAAHGLDFTVEKISDLKSIQKFGVLRTPALAVDGIVKVAGRVPSVEEIREMLGGSPKP